MGQEATYCLSAGVQVRREKFGLLFYDYRGPRLYFAPTRDLIQEDFFAGRLTVADLTGSICEANGGWPRNLVQGWIERTLETLVGKGLIREQSVC
jgi:putative mycofactocin binding protein MftB